MMLLNGFSESDSPGSSPYYKGVVAIGNFDGVHRGHQQMLAVLKKQADELGVPAVVMTFDPPPAEILRGLITPRLCRPSRKIELLAAYGVDVMIVVPTTRQLLALSPQQFFDDIILNQLQASGIVEGPNFCFGKDRAGNTDTLRELCEQSKLHCHIVEPIQTDETTEAGETMISSSRIRHCLQAGDVSEAAKLLGHRYRLSGTVHTGAGRGAEIGFPTANLTDIETLLPANGVYAGSVRIENHPSDQIAAIHIGPNPTFADEQQKVELFVLDFEGDLYGKEIDIDFWQRLRGTVNFPNVNALQAQIRDDIQQVRAVAKQFANR